MPLERRFLTRTRQVLLWSMSPHMALLGRGKLSRVRPQLELMRPETQVCLHVSVWTPFRKLR